jgi:hypothetical protein
MVSLYTWFDNALRLIREKVYARRLTAIYFSVAWQAQLFQLFTTSHSSNLKLWLIMTVDLVEEVVDTIITEKEDIEVWL